MLATFVVVIHVCVAWRLSDTPLNYVGPAIPIYGAIAAWAYLNATTRLGVVDLFACEISTLCRVGTIFDIGKRYVAMYHSGAIDKQTAHSAKFVSSEDYFPIFDNNSRDLEALEALVVINITEFYTYMKATRDSQRKLADTELPQAPFTGSEPDLWHVALANMIYMLYLGYESARKAVKDLIEFEPTRAEDTMVILLSELACYAFLSSYFKDDELRSARLELRRADYVQSVRALYSKVAGSHGDNEKYWAPARETAPELKKRFEECFQVSIDGPIRDLA